MLTFSWKCEQLWLDKQYKRNKKCGSLALLPVKICYKPLQIKLETTHNPSSHHTQDYFYFSHLVFIEGCARTLYIGTMKPMRSV